MDLFLYSQNFKLYCPFLYVFILPGPGTIPRIVCAFVQLVPIVGGLNVFTLMFIIGIDRMLGIFFPIWFDFY